MTYMTTHDTKSTKRFKALSIEDLMERELMTRYTDDEGQVHYVWTEAGEHYLKARDQ